MTALLEQAIESMRKLSPGEQDAIAALILENLKDEEAWESLFENTGEEKFGRMADRVREEIRQEKVDEIGEVL